MCNKYQTMVINGVRVKRIVLKTLLFFVEWLIKILKIDENEVNNDNN